MRRSSRWTLGINPHSTVIHVCYNQIYQDKSSCFNPDHNFSLNLTNSFVPKPNQTPTVWWGYVSHTLRSCCFACFSCSQVARIDLLLVTHYDCRYIVFCSDCISALLGRTVSSVHANRSNNSGRESVGVCISSLSCHLHDLSGFELNETDFKLHCSFVFCPATSSLPRRRQKHRSRLSASYAEHYPDIPVQTGCHDHFSAAH